MSGDIRSYFSQGAKPNAPKVESSKNVRNTRASPKKSIEKNKKKKRKIVDSDSDTDNFEPKIKKTSVETGSKKQNGNSTKIEKKEVSLSDVFSKTPIHRIVLPVIKSKNIPKITTEESIHENEDFEKELLNLDLDEKLEKTDKFETMPTHSDITDRLKLEKFKSEGKKESKVKDEIDTPTANENDISIINKKDDTKTTPKDKSNKSIFKQNKHANKKSPNLNKQSASFKNELPERSTPEKKKDFKLFMDDSLSCIDDSMSEEISLSNDKNKSESKRSNYISPNRKSNIIKTPTSEKSRKRKLNETMTELTDEERHERMRYKALLFKNYKNRPAPKNLGAKEVPKGSPNCLKGFVFLVTGVLDSFNHEDIDDIVKNHGGEIKKSVTKKVTHLVCGDDPGPSKTVKAEELGVKIISEDEFLSMIKDVKSPNKFPFKQEENNKKQSFERKRTRSVTPKKERTGSESPNKKSSSPVKNISKTESLAKNRSRSKTPVKKNTKNESPITTRSKSKTPIKNSTSSESLFEDTFVKKNKRNESPIELLTKSKNPVKSGMKSKSPFKNTSKSKTPVKTKNTVRESPNKSRSKSKSNTKRESSFNDSTEIKTPVKISSKRKSPNKKSNKSETPAKKSKKTIKVEDDSSSDSKFVETEAESLNAIKQSELNNNLSLTEKYRPTTLKQIIGQHGEASCASKLNKWLSKWYQNRKIKHSAPNPWSKGDGGYYKAALLCGPPGVGKTTTANVISKELGFDVIEFNASDTRSKTLLKDQISELTKTNTLFGYMHGKKSVTKKHVIIMDEVDGMAGNEDRGGMQELLSLIRETSIPIICICNDKTLMKMRSLVTNTFDLTFSRPKVEQIKSAIRSICFKECIKIPQDSFNEIIIGASQDMRQILNLLSMWSVNNKNLSSDSISRDSKLIKKDMKMGPWTVLRSVFTEDEHKKMNIYDKSDLFFHDYSLAPLFVQQNYLKVIPHCSKNLILERFAETADSLSIGDLVEAKIRGSMAWNLLPVQAMFSSVIPGAKLSGHISGTIDFPTWLGQNSRQSKLNRLVQEINSHTKLSTSGSKQSIRLDYAKHIRDAILKPLSKDGIGGVDKSIEVLESYHLLREDMESLEELTKWNRSSLSKDIIIDSKVKSALTRKYNKTAAPLPYSQINVKKSKAQNKDTDIDEAVDAENVECEEEENSDIENDAMIKKSIEPSKGAKTVKSKKPKANKKK